MLRLFCIRETAAGTGIEQHPAPGVDRRHDGRKGGMRQWITMEEEERRSENMRWYRVPCTARCGRLPQASWAHNENVRLAHQQKLAEKRRLIGGERRSAAYNGVAAAWRQGVAAAWLVRKHGRSFSVRPGAVGGAYGRKRLAVACVGRVSRQSASCAHQRQPRQQRCVGLLAWARRRRCSLCSIKPLSGIWWRLTAYQRARA